MLISVVAFVVGIALYLTGKFIAEETCALNTGKAIGFTGLALAAAPIIVIMCEAPR